MSFDEQPDVHCTCCRAWEERLSEIKVNFEKAIVAANDAMTKDGEGLTLSQRMALVKAIREAK